MKVARLYFACVVFIKHVKDSSIQLTRLVVNLVNVIVHIFFLYVVLIG